MTKTKKCRTHTKATTSTANIDSCNSDDRLVHADRRKNMDPSRLSTMKAIGVDGSRTKVKLLEAEIETVSSSPTRRHTKKFTTATSSCSNRKGKGGQTSKPSKESGRKTSTKQKKIVKTKKVKKTRTTTSNQYGDDRLRTNSDLTDSNAVVTARLSFTSVAAKRTTTDTTATTTTDHCKFKDPETVVLEGKSTLDCSSKKNRNQKEKSKSSKSELKKQRVDDKRPTEKSISSKKKKTKTKNENPEGKQQKYGDNQDCEVVLRREQKSRRGHVSHGPECTTNVLQHGTVPTSVKKKNTKKKKNRKRGKQGKKGADQRERRTIDRVIVETPFPKERRKSKKKKNDRVKKTSNKKKKTKHTIKASQHGIRNVSKKAKKVCGNTTVEAKNRVDSVERPTISLKQSTFSGPTTHFKVTRQGNSWRLLPWSLQGQRSMSNRTETTWTSKRSIAFMEEAESCFLTTASTMTSRSTGSSSSLSSAENNGKLPWFVNRSSISKGQDFHVKTSTRPEGTMEMIFFDSSLKEENFGQMTTNSK